MRIPRRLECWLAAGKSQVMAGGTAARGRALPVVIFDRTVTLTLADAVVHRQPVTVSFTVLGGNPTGCGHYNADRAPGTSMGAARSAAAAVLEIWPGSYSTVADGTDELVADGTDEFSGSTPDNNS